MIPPSNYLTFRHMYNGSSSYSGKENFEKLYEMFLKNPIGNKCNSFSNELSTIELKVLKEGWFCIIFVLPSTCAWKSSWEQSKNDLDKLMECIEATMGDEYLIKAWDVLFNKFDHKLLNSCAVIGIESIMNTPFDKSVMVPGNIFITNKGKVVSNHLQVNDCMKMFEQTYGFKKELCINKI